MTTRQAARMSALIFGAGANACNMAELARVTRIPAPTLARYKARPDMIPIGKLRVIAEARKIPEEDLAKLLRR